MNGLDLAEFEKQDIKISPISEVQLTKMQKMAGSYEALFSRRSMKYKAWGLGAKELSEEDMKNYILEEYTFLKRPVFIIGDDIFIGNSKSVVDNVAEKLHNI